MDGWALFGALIAAGGVAFLIGAGVGFYRASVDLEKIKREEFARGRAQGIDEGRTDATRRYVDRIQRIAASFERRRGGQLVDVPTVIVADDEQQTVDTLSRILEPEVDGRSVQW